MRPGVIPHHISPLLPFQHGTNSVLDTAVTDHDVNVFSQISKDGKFIWLVRGPVIEVLSSSTRHCVASWVFGVTLKDTHSYITCVKEYCYGSNRKLLVGVCSALQSSMVCVFDILTSKVTKVIEVPHKVSSIEAVTNVGGDFIPLWALNDQLRLFHGIIAVGTISGIVYLIDMCLDEEIISDEVMPSKLQFVTPRSRDAADRRKTAISKGNQLCLVLDEESHGKVYKYRRCDGNILKTFNTDDVIVTCMKYIPQIGTLVVGFSFGSYQLWKINVPVLEYSSRVDVDNGSVLHIIYQEPENDPKNFCYLWIVRGGDTEEEETISSAALYQLAYNKKTWYSNYGAFYEELTSVSLRFDLDLTANLLSGPSNTTESSRAITSFTLEDPNYSAPAKLNEEESFEESIHGPDLSRCLFVWESSEGNKKTCQMAVFDMNRWYHAQMPGALRCVGGNLDTCPYLSIHNLDDAINKSALDALLAVHIYTNSMKKFVNTSPLPPEQHFYPASLAFDALLVMESGLIKGHFLGTQRQVLASMEKIGPSILLNCKELYNLCIYMGLLPRPLDVASHNPTAVQMRENLLTMALEYNMLPFIIRCVQDWSPGGVYYHQYVHHGCTLKFVLDWAWSRVVHIKNTIDITCKTLFDWSGIVLDNRGLQNLHQSYQRLSHLTAIFRTLLNQASPTTEQGFTELQNKLSVIVYITQYLQVVLWFVGAGLLPEHDELEEHLLPGQYCYPAVNLIQSFTQRRLELQKLHQDIGEIDVLLIDGLISEMGPGVKDLWYKEGGSGLYPPPSLHALLNIYLLEGIDLMMKHGLLLYCLLDLVSLVDPIQHEQFSEKIGKFTKSLCIPFSVVKQIQGFWLLDHKDFEESMVVILDPLVTDNLGDWQHYRIVRSLLYQGDCKMALRYLTSRQPPLSTPEEVKIRLTVLLANGLTAEALEYQRTYREEDNMEDLLHHLFLGCQQTKTVDQLLQLPLTEDEENHLVKYLSDSKEPNSQELLVLHYLQRARYVEAIQLNEKLKHGIASEPSSKSRERAVARNSIVEGFLSVLSGVQRKLVFENQTVPKKNTAKRREVKKPEPLSTTVTKNSHARIVSKTNLFLEILERVQEVKYEDEEQQPNTKEQAEPDVGPFVYTPITPRTKSVFGQTQPVVYMAQSESCKKLPWQPTASALTPFTLSKMMSPVSAKRKSKIFGADALSMLQTPVPQRKSRSRSSTSVLATPQSILKVRQLISNKSPQISPSQSLTKVSEQEPEVLLGTPRSVSFRDTTLQGTPKQLRFMDSQIEEPEVESSPSSSPKIQKSALKSTPTPKSALKSTPKSALKSPSTSKSALRSTPKSALKSPSTSKSALRSPPSPKSVKDRSPTPESISRSPKHKANLDLLPRPPLHEHERCDTSNIEPVDDIHVKPADQTGDQSSMEDDAMETDVMVVDSDITFNFNKNAESGDEMMDSSTESIIVQEKLMETQQNSEDEPARPQQISILKKSSIMTSPVKLKHSPMKTLQTPRSPTVKLTMSPARGMIPPIFSMPNDELEFAETDMTERTPIEINKPIAIGIAVENSQPIEIGDSDEENEGNQNQNSCIPQVSFGAVIELDESKNQSYNTSEEDLDEKINEIENRITDFAQSEEIEEYEMTDKYLQPKTINKKSNRSIVVSFALPDSSSDKDNNQVTSEEEEVSEEVTSSDKEENQVFSDENVPDTSGDEEVDENEKETVSTTHVNEMEINDENQEMEIGEAEEIDKREIEEAEEKVEVSPAVLDEKETDISSALETKLGKDSSIVESLIKDIEPSQVQSDISENSDEEVTEFKEDQSKDVRESLSGNQEDYDNEKEPAESVEAGLPPLVEMEEGCFENNSLPETEDEAELVLELSYDNTEQEKYKTIPSHEAVTRLSTTTESSEPQLRRSSRRLSSMSKSDDIDILKSPGRRKKMDVTNEPPKSPGRRKSVLKSESEAELTENETKSPSRRGRKSVQNKDETTTSPVRGKGIHLDDIVETEVLKSPSRRKNMKSTSDVDVAKSPGRRKGKKNVDEQDNVHSPDRTKSVKDSEKAKSPSRRKSLKNVDDTESPKSPGRRKTSKVNEDTEIVKSPSRRKSLKPNGEAESAKSPGRRKSKSTEDSLEVSKSPRRGKSILKDAQVEIDNDSQKVKSPSRRKSVKNAEVMIENEQFKSPGRKNKILETETSESAVPKSPGRRSRLKSEDDSHVIIDSPSKNRSRSPSGSKSPGRKTAKKTETMDEEMDNVNEIEVHVKKSPGRKKKTNKSFTGMRSPSRRSTESDAPLASWSSLRSHSPPSKSVKEDGSEKMTERMDETSRSNGEILTPPESEIDSPNKNKKKERSTRSLRDRQSITPSRKSKRIEDKTPDISDAESEVAAAVFSFSDPMQVDLPLEDFTKVKESSEVQSFIFSPPAQPRSRRSSFSNEPSQLANEEISILLPPSTLREPVRSREGTPVKSASKRGRRRKGSESEISVPLPIPEEPVGMSTEESDVPGESEPPVKKEKRPKRGKKKLLNYDEVNLISPIKEEEEGEIERPLTRQRLRREQEMPIMNLRGGKAKTGTLPKKKRVAKLW